MYKCVLINKLNRLLFKHWDGYSIKYIKYIGVGREDSVN